MTTIVDEDDAVVAAAWALLRGDEPEGTENLRTGETDDGSKYVYRIDPDADPDAVDDVRPDGEFPEAEATRWRADREAVQREVGRRGIEGASRSTAGESAGNR